MVIGGRSRKPPTNLFPRANFVSHPLDSTPLPVFMYVVTCVCEDVQNRRSQCFKCESLKEVAEFSIARC